MKRGSGGYCAQAEAGVIRESGRRRGRMRRSHRNVGGSDSEPLRAGVGEVDAGMRPVSGSGGGRWTSAPAGPDGDEVDGGVVIGRVDGRVDGSRRWRGGQLDATRRGPWLAVIFGGEGGQERRRGGAA